jgi:hypothetical protein
MGETFREHGDERRRGRSFSNETTQQVRNAKRDEKGVRLHTGAKHRSNHHVAQQAGYTAQQREKADLPGGLHDGALFGLSRVVQASLVTPTLIALGHHATKGEVERRETSGIFRR